MSYEVVLTDAAHQDAQEAYDWYADRSKDAAAKWLAALHESLRLLSKHPDRFALALENERFPMELRQVAFGGGKRLTHRLVYVVRPKRVVVYAVRHLARQDLSPDDL